MQMLSILVLSTAAIFGASLAEAEGKCPEIPSSKWQCRTDNGTSEEWISEHTVISHADWFMFQNTTDTDSSRGINDLMPADGRKHSIEDEDVTGTRLIACTDPNTLVSEFSVRTKDGSRSASASSTFRLVSPTRVTIDYVETQNNETLSTHYICNR